MKRIVIFSFLLTLGITLNAQVFNTSSTLKKGNFSVGFEPGVYTRGGTNFNLYLNGGVGITSGVDLGIKFGIGETTYFGGDVEFMLGKIFSLSAGAHVWGDFGLDITPLFTFSITSGVDLYTGLDLDIAFYDRPLDDGTDIEFPLWLPIGLQVAVKNNVAFIFETSIGLTDFAPHWIGGGLNFFF